MCGWGRRTEPERREVRRPEALMRNTITDARRTSVDPLERRGVEWARHVDADDFGCPGLPSGLNDNATSWLTWPSLSTT